MPEPQQAKPQSQPPKPDPQQPQLQATQPQPTRSIEPVVFRAPAKLTLSLRICGVRPDGYHLLEAEMVALDFFDELTVMPKPDNTPSSLQIIDNTPTPTQLKVASLGAVSENLIMKALSLAGKTADITLRKCIPPGAGLGGGSSNAAAILRWAGELDPERAVRLGADVPFCLSGGRARVAGIGEHIEPLPFRPVTYTLLIPPFGCSTAEVYQAWDDMDSPKGRWGNDLEPAAIAVEPRLELYRDELARVSGGQPRLAGSGSTWFVEGAFPGGGRVVARTLPQMTS